jgi:DNA-binding NtrC family response regulator
VSERADKLAALILRSREAAGTTSDLAEILVTSGSFSVVHRNLPENVAGDSAASEVQRLVADCAPDLVLLSLHRPSAAGDVAEILGAVRDVPLLRTLLVAVENGSTEGISRLLHLGVADFLCPPFVAWQVLPRIHRALEASARSRRPVETLRRELGLRHLVGESPSFRRQVERVSLVARNDVTVLICGETGTGKELFGRAIHYLSPRARGPFVPVNCGAVPPDLIENELFGHQRSAYTGAASSAPGLVAEAEGGTLFLDEIDALPPGAQTKLLRFLQEKEYRPLGSTAVRKADVRVAAVTNADPEAAVEDGRLRRDLFYRLNVVRLELPPLRRRPEDVPLLAEHFLDRFNRKFGKRVPGFSTGALEILSLHRWPGNVRELEHLVERCVLLSEEAAPIGREALGLSPAGSRRTSFREAKAQAVADFERRYVGSLLAAHRGNISRAARAASKDRKSFWLLVRKHRFDVDRFRR